MSTISAMATSPRKRLLETSALVVGYAMSRLDRAYLDARHLKSWKEAYEQAANLLKVRPASFKNLRDEFDPVHGNARAGWKGRPMRRERQRVVGELCEVSDAALLEMIDAILRHDADAVQDVVAPLSQPTKRIHNVAERLRTGRLAEAFFRDNCQKIAGILASSLLDHRELFRGYDFAVQDRPALAIEVKGMKQLRGGITFSDREWTEAKTRRQDYWLVVVGNVELKPVARVVADPTATLEATCRYQTTIAASWRATVAVS
jgi:hypothetical protein